MSGFKRHPVRVTWRLLVFSLTLLFAALDYIFYVRLRGRAGRMRERACWQRRSSRRLFRAINGRLTVVGEPPVEAGLLVSNHLSYLDIIVYGQTRPFVFVSKAEVRQWPAIGWLTECAGTLFIKREQKSDVVRLAAALGPVVAAGEMVVLFPEGTSSDGRQVLAFRSSLLEPAAAQDWPVTPAWIGYALNDGLVEDEVCYWRDMTFGPHFLNLLSKQTVHARVVFGSALPRGLDRKALALAAREQVETLRRTEQERTVAVPLAAG